MPQPAAQTMRDRAPPLSISSDDLKPVCARLKAEPLDDLPRPVVVLSGYRSPIGQAGSVAAQLRRLTLGPGGARRGTDRRFLPIAYTFGGDIDAITAGVVRRINKQWPPPETHEGKEPRTIEVDVVGISMGGLVGRLAASPLGTADRNDKRTHRVRIGTLYTIVTPHRGAKIANLVALDPAAKAMKPGSAFLDTLHRAYARATGDERYPIVPYAQTNDLWVGVTPAAPVGQDPIWAHGTMMFSHFLAPRNPRIMADIALRLRGETPVANEPAPAVKE